MGLFSPKKTIKVASTVYNMAGPEANRPNFLKSTMFGAVMNPNGSFLGETLIQSYLGGPGINQRLLFNYAVRNNYPGLPTLSFSKQSQIDPEAVRPFITIPDTPSGLVLRIQDAFVMDGDVDIFAERYMNENYPEEIDSDWVAEYDVEEHEIIIQREGGGTVTFAAGSFDPRAKFVVSRHFFELTTEIGSLDEGDLTEGVTSGLPSLTGFTLESESYLGNVTYEQNQTRVIEKVYSNGSPTTTDTDYPYIETDFNTTLTVHTKDEYNGGDGLNAETSTTRTYRRVWEYREVYTSSSEEIVVNDIGGGHTETVTTTITGDFLRAVYDWQLDTQLVSSNKVVGGNKIFIYKVGTGNEDLDELVEEVSSEIVLEYYPFIPIRLNNKSITEPEFSDLYEKSRKLYRRATRNQGFDSLIEEVEDNEDLEEIDYAYVQWGISLNTTDNQAKRYIYEFWKNLIPLHGLPSDYMDTLNSGFGTYISTVNNFSDWIAAQSDPDDPLYGTERPNVPQTGDPQTITLKLVTDHEDLTDFDNRISFTFIKEETFSGLGKLGAKKGEYWIVGDDDLEWDVVVGVNSFTSSLARTMTNNMSVFSIYWQNTDSQYKKVTVYGALFENYIYKGKAVRITAQEALDDEDESGFIIPLHYPTLKSSGLISSTQLSTMNTYIVFNSYQVYKKKWYETFLGMLFIVIVVVVAAALIAPATVGGISGIFGTNAAVGAGLGLSGTSAIVAGAVANALAAVLISTALTTASTAIFGEKWGAVFASVLSFAISFGMAGGFANLSTLFQPQNLLALSSSLANGYAGYIRGSIAEMQMDMFEVQEDYEREMNRIQDLMGELMGNDLAFDPMSLTDAGRGNGTGTGYMPEGLDDFIQRTTLTGSDIVEMTLSIVNDFADLSLTLPRT